MLITSVTDASAFLANVYSIVPAIRTFGIFMASLIAINFLLVITWFPACCVLSDRLARCTRTTTKRSAGVGASSGKPRRPHDGGDEPRDPAPMPDTTSGWVHRLEKFLAGRLLRWLLRLRWVVLGTACGLLGVTSYAASRYEPAEQGFQYQTFAPATNAFASAALAFAIFASSAFASTAFA